VTKIGIGAERRGTMRVSLPGLVLLLRAGIMRPAMPAKVPELNRLRIRELFFVFLGVATGAGLAVYWFRVVPELLARQGLDLDVYEGFAAVLSHPIVQALVLAAGAVILAAGIATRLASGKDRATWILAAGSLLLFGSLLLSVNVLQPAIDAASADDWGDDPTP
jgi:hypothetical protein